jgi:hypothetical protein
MFEVRCMILWRTNRKGHVLTGLLGKMKVIAFERDIDRYGTQIGISDTALCGRERRLGG